MHPAEKKSPDRTEATAQVRVLSARFGNHRAQFRIGERAKKRKNRADNPSGEYYRDEAALAGHFGRLEKNAGANHRAYDDCAGGPCTEAADKIELLRRCFRERFLGCHDFPFLSRTVVLSFW